MSDNDLTALVETSRFTANGRGDQGIRRVQEGSGGRAWKGQEWRLSLDHIFQCLEHPVFLLTVYSKGDMDNLSDAKCMH